MRMKTNVDKISAPNSQFFQSDSQHTSKHSKHKKRNGLISINTKGDDTVVSSSVSAGGASESTSEQNTDYMQKNQSGAKGSQDSNTHYDPKKISQQNSMISRHSTSLGDRIVRNKRNNAFGLAENSADQTPGGQSTRKKKGTSPGQITPRTTSNA